MVLSLLTSSKILFCNDFVLKNISLKHQDHGLRLTFEKNLKLAVMSSSFWLKLQEMDSRGNMENEPRASFF